MTRAIYPGTFDPITRGHLDVIDRASKLFEKVEVVVANNTQKKTLFNAGERVDLIRECIAHFKNVEVATFSGLTVDYLKSRNAQVIIRGLRAVSDFEFEFQMALMNKKLEPQCETIYMMPGASYTYLNSSIIKEIGSMGGNIRDFVTPNVEKALAQKLAR